MRAPRANAVAERVIRTLRNECLDHLIIINEQHLQAVLAEFVEYYNTERPHRSLLLETPRPAARPTTGSVHSRSVLGALHHVYERAGWASPTFPPLQGCWVGFEHGQDEELSERSDR